MKKKVRYLLLMLIAAGTVLCGVLLVFVGVSSSALSDSLKRAGECMENSDYSGALTHISEVIKTDPVNVEALGMLESISLLKNDAESAATIRMRLVNLDPLDITRVQRYCETANDARYYKEVLDFLEGQKKKRQLTLPELVERGIALLRSGNLEEIEELYEKIQASEESERKTRFLADYSLRTGNAAKAAEYYRTLAETARNVFLKSDALICLAKMTPDKAQKEEWLKKAVEINPRMALPEYAELLLRDGRCREMLEEYDGHKEVVQNSLKIRIYAAEAALLLEDAERLAELSESLTGLSREIAVAKNYMEAMSAFLVKDYVLTADKLSGATDYSERIPCKYMGFISLAASRPQDPKLTYLYTELFTMRPDLSSMLWNVLDEAVKNLMSMKNYDRARVLINLVTADGGTSDFRTDALLDCLLGMKKPDIEVKNLAEKILKDRPEHRKALELKARFQRTEGNEAGAIETLETLWMGGYESLPVFLNLTGLYIRNGRTGDAENISRQAMDKIGLRNSAYMFLGTLYVKNNRKAEAEALTAELLKSDKEGEKLLGRFMLGMYCELNGEAAGALEHYEALLGTKEETEQLFIRLVKLAEQLNDSVKMEKYCREGMKKYPEQLVFPGKLAVLLASRGQDKEAAEYYEAALAGDDGNWLLHLNYSECLAVLGERDNALNHAVRAKTLQPLKPAAAEACIIRLQECGRNEDVLREMENFKRRFKQMTPRLEIALKKAMEAIEAEEKQ